MMQCVVFVVLLWIGLIEAYSITNVQVISFGKQLSVRFMVDGKKYKFDDLEWHEPIHLPALRKLDASVASTTFSALHRQDNTWATVTLLKNNRLSGVFSPYGNGVLYEIHDYLYEESVIQRVLNAKKQQNRILSSPMTTMEAPGVNGKNLKKMKLKMNNRRGANRKKNSRALDSSVTAWFGSNSCFNKDYIKRKVYIGLAVDQSLLNRCNSNRGCDLAKDLEMTVARASSLFNAQLNVELVVNQIVFPFSPQAPSFLTSAVRMNTQIYDLNTGRTTEQACCADSLTLTDRLNAFKDWFTSLPVVPSATAPYSKLATWHLLTDCHPSPGFVGRAFIGTLCSKEYSVGVTSYGNTASTYLWRIFTHELGHTFNASHAFEKGQGKTGGVMDYGDGLFNGSFQFDPLRREEICSEIDSQVDGCLYVEPSLSVCGDGVVERRNLEECECENTEQTTVVSCAACHHCRLVSGFDCVPGEQCCGSDGKFLPSSATCVGDNEEVGTCVNGYCEVNICPKFYQACAVQNEGECATACCLVRDASVNVTRTLPDGVGCTTGKCSGGVCGVYNPPTPTIAGCVDSLPVWWDNDGPRYTCAWYASRSENCRSYSHQMGNFGLTGADVCCACGGGQVDQCPPEAVYNTCVWKTTQAECASVNSTCSWCGSFCLPSNFPNACNNPALYFSKCGYAKTIIDKKEDVDFRSVVEDEAYAACPWEKKAYSACARFRSKSSCLKGRRKKTCAWCSDEKGFHCLPPMLKSGGNNNNRCPNSFKQYEKCL